MGQLFCRGVDDEGLVWTVEPVTLKHLWMCVVLDEERIREAEALVYVCVSFGGFLAPF